MVYRHIIALSSAVVAKTCPKYIALTPRHRFLNDMVFGVVRFLVTLVLAEDFLSRPLPVFMSRPVCPMMRVSVYEFFHPIRKHTSTMFVSMKLPPSIKTLPELPRDYRTIRRTV